jgi:hypothetical protein
LGELYAAPASQAAVPRSAPGCFARRYRSLSHTHTRFQHVCGGASKGPKLLSLLERVSVGREQMLIDMVCFVCSAMLK